jgi:hypothetical protein
MTISNIHTVKNKGFFEFKNETLFDLFFELHKIQYRNIPLSEVEKFQIECKFTDILNKLVDVCNKYFFFNFNLELRMEDIEDAY